MNRKLQEIPVISQNIYTTMLDEVNHRQITADVNNYGIGMNQNSSEYGWISRGFVQYEDIIIPVTPEIQKLEDEILSIMQQMTNKEYCVKDIWAINLIENQSVIAHSHHSNLHAHPSEYYSVAYYPEVPDGSAELIFLAEWCGVMQRMHAVTPSVGMLVIFNSYMTHMTARQKINKPRLVVSMNLEPVNPNTEPNADWSVYWDRPIIASPIIV